MVMVFAAVASVWFLSVVGGPALGRRWVRPSAQGMQAADASAPTL